MKPFSTGFVGRLPATVEKLMTTNFGEMLAMHLRKIFSQIVASLLTLLCVAPAVAQGTTSPVGRWEASAGGKFQGEIVKGTAYVEFYANGTVGGYYMSRMDAAASEIEGTWEQVQKKFVGSVDLSNDDGLIGRLSMSGSAKQGMSMSANFTDAFGSKVTLKGKPLVLMTDLSGDYEGTGRQWGAYYDYDLYLEINLELDEVGGYFLTGVVSYEGSTDQLSGYVVVNRKGQYVAYIYNETSGIYSGVWGQIKAGVSFNGSGFVVNDGARLNVTLTQYP